MGAVKGAKVVALGCCRLKLKGEPSSSVCSSMWNVNPAVGCRIILVAIVKRDQH